MRQWGKQPGNESKSGTFIVGLVIRAFSVSVEVFLRDSRTFGERYLGIQAGAAVALILAYGEYCDPADAEGMYWFLCLYLIACAVAKGQSAARRRRGELGSHSYYGGRPLLMRLSPRAREGHVKAVLEPIAVWLTAAVVAEFNPGLGAYLALAGIAVLVTEQLANVAERKRVLDMHDAYMQQRNTAEQWRGMNRD